MSRPARLAAVALVCAIALAAASAPPPASDEFARLIEQLGDRSYVVREAAERRLAAAGTAAVPPLRKALGRGDVDVRRRILRLIPALEIAGIVAPKRLSLDVKDVPFDQVLAAITRQTGYKILNQGVVRRPARGVGGKAADDKFTYAFLDAPFWEVMDAVCRDSGLGVLTGYADDTIRLSNVGTRPFGGQVGAFRYSATYLQSSREVDLSSGQGRTPAAADSLVLTLSLIAEPRLPFLGFEETRLGAAYDGEGNSMVPPASPSGGIRPGGRYFNGGFKQQSLNAIVALRRASAKSTTLKTLRATVPVYLLVEERPVVVSAKILSAAGARVTAGDVDFRIDEVKKVGNVFAVKLTATNRGALAGSNWYNTLPQRLEMSDAKGNKLPLYDTNWQGMGADSVSLTLTYGSPNAAAAGDPLTFTFLQWVTRRHEIEVEFTNVPLP